VPVEHVYESPDVVRRDATFHDDEPYTPTSGQHHQHHHQQHQQQQQQQASVMTQQSAPPPQPHHGYWPLPPSPGHDTGVKAKTTGNYSL